MEDRNLCALKEPTSKFPMTEKLMFFLWPDTALLCHPHLD